MINLSIRSTAKRASRLVKEFLRNIKGIDKKVFAGVIAVMLICASFGVMANYYTLAYDIYYKDEYIGVVSGKNEAAVIMDETGITDGVRLVLRIAPVAAINNGNISIGIIVAATDAERCVTICAKDREIVSVADQTAANAAVTKYAESYGGTWNEIVSEYSIKEDAVVKENIKSVSEAAAAIAESGLITVRYEKTVVEDIILPYDVERVNDSSVACGTEVKSVEGTEGLDRVTSTAIYENGGIVEMLDKKEEHISDPINAVIKVGTRLGGLPNDITCPVKGVLTSSFGERWGRNHNGIDIGAPIGTPVYAPVSGSVTFASYKGGYGNYIQINHGANSVTCYAHLTEMYVTPGQTVEAGQIIGTVGVTGNVTGPHLHFEIIQNGSFVDPEPYIKS